MPTPGRLGWFIAAVVLGVFVVRSETFQRTCEPRTYWKRKVSALEEQVAADRRALQLTGVDIQRRRAALPFDLAEDRVLSGGDPQLSEGLREATLEEYHAAVDSMLERIAHWRRETADDRSKLEEARTQLHVIEPAEVVVDSASARRISELAKWITNPAPSPDSSARATSQ